MKNERRNGRRFLWNTAAGAVRAAALLAALSLAAGAEPYGDAAQRVAARGGDLEAKLRAYVARFNADDTELYTNAIPNAAAADFLAANVPLLDCPDPEIERTYYFRWWTYRIHIKKSPAGWIILEFIPDVPWAGKHNTICGPAGHHILEGRWLRDRRYITDYARFWFGGEASATGSHAYGNWIIHAVCEAAKVSGDAALPKSLLDGFAAFYDDWEKGWYDRARRWTYEGGDWVLQQPPFFIGYRPEAGLFSMIDDREGSEFSLGGQGYRPLFNTEMWSAAKAIERTARAAGRDALAAKYAAKADALEAAMKAKLWHPSREFFTVLSTNGEHKAVRELHGYAPWFVKMPLKGYEAAWKPLMRTDGFNSPYGLTVPERAAEGFAVAYKGHDCQWNGPIWPFATTFALTGLSNALQAGYDLPATPLDFVEQLHKYAAAHRLRLADGREVMWIDENQSPYDGDWLSRTILRLKKNFRYRERGKDYNHSTFCDIVLTGLAGLVPRDDDTLEVAPLFPADWPYFRVERLAYHGRDVTISWDRDGGRYGDKAGFRVYVDGRPVAERAKPGRVTAALPR